MLFSFTVKAVKTVSRNYNLRSSVIFSASFPPFDGEIQLLPICEIETEWINPNCIRAKSLGKATFDNWDQLAKHKFTFPQMSC